MILYFIIILILINLFYNKKESFANESNLDKFKIIYDLSDTKYKGRLGGENYSSCKYLLNEINNKFSHILNYKKYVVKFKHTNNKLYRNIIFSTSSNLDNVIIIVAHYDHLGVIDGEIHPGANDNMTGVWALLNLAKYLINIKDKLNYTFVFLLSDGEEQGSIGTEYLRKEGILDSLNIRYAINIDMLGSCPKEINLYYVKSNLNLIKKAQKKSNMNLNIIECPQSIINRCDYKSFNNYQGFILGGCMDENYHKPTDTPKKLNFKLVEKSLNFLIKMCLILNENKLNKF